MKAYTIKKPIITEKTLDLANKQNTYTFFVDRVATKPQIKTAVEHFFTVTVEKVRTIMNSPQVKRTGKKRMTVKNIKQKKALVTLKQGQTIDLFDTGEQK